MKLNNINSDDLVERVEFFINRDDRNEGTPWIIADLLIYAMRDITTPDKLEQFISNHNVGIFMTDNPSKSIKETIIDNDWDLINEIQNLELTDIEYIINDPSDPDSVHKLFSIDNEVLGSILTKEIATKIALHNSLDNSGVVELLRHCKDRTWYDGVIKLAKLKNS